MIELLAVVMVIALLTAIVAGVAGYVQKQTGKETSRAQIAALALAIESYKSDWGYYPASTPVRISTRMIGEATNNAILYRALFCQGKTYLAGFPTTQIRPNNATATNNAIGGLDFKSALTNIFDAFGTPFNYYQSPNTAYGLSNNVYGVDYYCGYTVGGQVNRNTFDLFSYGPDRITLADTNAVAVDINRPWAPAGWKLTSSANDDIRNWRQ